VLFFRFRYLFLMVGFIFGFYGVYHYLVSYNDVCHCFYEYFYVIGEPADCLLDIKGSIYILLCMVFFGIVLYKSRFFVHSI